MIIMLLVECIKAADSGHKLKEKMQYIVTNDCLGLHMYYLLEGLEKEAAYPAIWFRIVNRDYHRPDQQDESKDEQISLF